LACAPARGVVIALLLSATAALGQQREETAGMLPAQARAPALRELNLQLGRAVAELGHRGVVGPAEMLARLAREKDVERRITQIEALVMRAEEARFQMQRPAAVAAATAAVEKLGSMAGRYVAPELEVKAQVVLALALMLKPADPGRAELAFASALAIDPSLQPDRDRMAPHVVRLLEHAKRKAGGAGTPTMRELGLVANMTGLRYLIWFAVRKSELDLLVYDHDRRTVRVRSRHGLAEREVMREVAARISAALDRLRSPLPPAATPPARDQLPVEPVPEPPRRQRAAEWVVSALGVAALASGTALLLVSRGRNDDALALAHRVPLVEYEPEAQDLEESARIYKVAGIVSLSVGCVAAAVALYLWLRPEPQRRAAAPPRVAVGPGSLRFTLGPW
jgi:hypothetical protein